MKRIFLPVLVCLALAACETEPHRGRDEPPGPVTYAPPSESYATYQRSTLPPPRSANAAPTQLPPPRVASAGPLKTATVGSYMDNQEQDFRRALHGMIVVVSRPGDDIVLNLRSDVMFEGNSLDLTDDAQRILSTIAPILRRYDHTLVFINGYTDTTGSAAQNMAVSRKRAFTVGGQLVKDGVALSRLQATGYGETVLKVKTGDQVNEPRNRRIEIRISARAAR